MDEAENNARRVCEDHLQEQIRYNREHKILPSEIAVAERMLANGGALQRKRPVWALSREAKRRELRGDVPGQ
jgi:hypothetical protein